MPGTVSIKGGTVNIPLNGQELSSVQSALTALSNQFSSGHLFTNPATAPALTGLNTYNFTGASGGSVTMPSGAQAVVLNGATSTKVVASNTVRFLSGNTGNDTIVGGQMTSTIISGDGNNSINNAAATVKASILTGTGKDTVVLGSKGSTLTALGSVTVTGGGGSNTISITGNSKTASLGRPAAIS